MNLGAEHNEQFEVRIGDLPADLLDNVTRFVGRFSVSLLLDDLLAGSGTLIKCKNMSGILTAHHVVHNPKDRSKRFDFSWNSDQRLGLPLSDRPHHFDIPMRSVVCIDVGVPPDRDEFSGPDLSVLVLPPNEIGKIATRQSFIDISIEREQRLEESIAHGGLWAASGCPKYYQRSRHPSHGFGEVNEFRNVVLYTGICERYQEDEFDYLHLRANAPDDIRMPDTFGGMSGGGVWKLRLLRDRKTLDWSVDYKKSILAGVVFYETLSAGRPKELRCHGGRSIYQKVHERLVQRL